MEERQGYLRVLWESQEDRFAPYFQFSEQCVLPGVQEGYPFLFPYLKIVRYVCLGTAAQKARFGCRGLHSLQ